MNLDYCIRVNKPPVVYKKNQGLEVSVYCNFSKILSMHLQEYCVAPLISTYVCAVILPCI